MSKKLKDAHEAGRAADELERKPVWLREGVADIRKAAPLGGCEEELLNYNRDPAS
jgi:hypothetical protein